MKKSLLPLIAILCFQFFLLFGSNSGKILAQGSNYLDFLPLQVGNIWVYRCTQAGTPPGCGMCTYRIRVNITNTSTLNGKTYYHGQVAAILISGSCPGPCNSNVLNFDSYVRIDSASANVLEYSTNSGCPYRPNEILKDSIKARLLDSIRYDCQPPAQWTAYVCRDTNNVIIFGESRQSRGFSVQGFEGGWGRGYVRGLGISSAGSQSVFCNNQSQLLGCVINGVVYGDTGFMVGVNKISHKIPESFSLAQNYPNPFNPTTVISFQLPVTSYAIVKIYDISGNEIQTLVNEQFSPGSYEVEFDGTNYPSGVYFYKLTAGNYTETKRMVLLK